jgi:hypothetical protein
MALPLVLDSPILPGCEIDFKSEDDRTSRSPAPPTLHP